MKGAGGEPELARIYAEVMAAAATEREAAARALCGERAALFDEVLRLVRSGSASAGWLDRFAERVLPEATAALAETEPELAPGTRIGPWEIHGVAGRGGMGVVYRARDLALERWVALKFLPAAPGTTDGVALLAEARAAAALDHPDLAVVYQVGTTDDASALPGRHYLASAFHEGRTIREHLSAGPLPPARALEWAVRIADVLAHAHAAGVIHGDIKAGNVMITDRGELKVLDFGVAVVRGRPVAGAGAGTPAVMSPEQIRGEPLDGRSDLWSLGVLLFEMLTGARPFAGRSGDEIMRAIEAGAVPDVADLVPAIPAAAVAAIRRCLARDPGDRYAGAEALRTDLRLAQAALSREAAQRPGNARGVLVLPFVNISPDPDTEYFADGLTEEVIHHLSGARGLRVISSASMMRLKGRGDPATQLGDELGVRYVVEGSVRKAGERIRVTTRLVDRVGGDHTELRRHDGTLDDVFAIQEEVAREVLAQLPGAPSRALRRRFVERPIADPGAFDAYLRARHEAWRFSADGLARARRYIDAGLAIVGDNALLYSTLGHILAMAHESGIEPGPETLARVEELSRTVSALDPDHGRGHWLRGFAAFQKGALGEAIEAGEAALASDPADPDTLLLLGYVYVHVGRNREARDLFSRAIDVDPLTPLTRCMPGMVDLMEGRYGGAVAAYRQAREMDPESPFSVFMYGWVLAQAGRSSEAIGELAATAERFPDTVFGLLAASLAAGLDGRRAQARAPLAGLAGAGQGSEMIARLLCHAHTLAGERERGLDWLDRAIDLGMLNRGFLEAHDRLVAPLRSEPRFARLMERVGRRLAALA